MRQRQSLVYFQDLLHIFKTNLRRLDGNEFIRSIASKIYLNGCISTVKIILGVMNFLFSTCIIKISLNSDLCNGKISLLSILSFTGSDHSSTYCIRSLGSRSFLFWTSRSCVGVQFSKCNEGTEFGEKKDGENHTIEGMLQSILQTSVFKINLCIEKLTECKRNHFLFILGCRVNFQQTWFKTSKQ